MNALELGVELGRPALDWVEKSLRDGLAVSAAVLASGRLSSMRCLALVPPGTPLEVLDNLEWDRFDASPSSVHILSELIQLLGAGEGVLLVEDELAHPDDEWIQRQGLEFPHFARGTELYHWLALPPGASADRIDGLLNESTSGYPTNAFVLKSSPDDFERIHRSPAAIASAVDAIVVSAYDDVAYVAAIPSA